MAGYTAPKETGTRARRNRDTAKTTELEFVRGVQPSLPADRDWHGQTVIWWETWGESSLSDHMTAVDWNVLLTTAVLVDKIWTSGSTEAAKEVRLREESFGASILARMRLRISFRTADESGVPERSSGVAAEAKSKYGNLAVVRPVGA